MRGILVTLFSVTALTSAAVVNPRCHKDPSQAAAICRPAGSEGVLVAHERCDKFYKCSHGKPVALVCPSNLLYNPELGYCDWPNAVDCGNRVVPGQGDQHGNGSVESDEDKEVFDNSGHEDPSQAHAICARPGSDGALIAHEHCTKFYKCFQSHPVEMKCPPSLNYNYKIKQCDWPQNVDCGNRVIPNEEDDSGSGNGPGDAGDNNNSSCNCNPSEAPEICAKNDSEGVLVAHEKCNKFYKCSHGLPTSQNCPPNLLYNAHLKACDWPHNVQCGDRVQPEHNDSEDNSKNEDDDVEEGHSDPSQAPSICAKNDSDSILIAHELCNHFYICLHGRPLPINCPPGLHFNPKSRKCDWPENVECRDRIIPEENTNITGVVEEKREIYNDPSKAAEICAQYDSVLVAHEKCNRFYQCAGGRPVERKCPRGLVYNYNVGQCDWISNVECGNRIIAEEEEEIKEPEPEPEKDVAGHEDPSKAPTICAEEESDGTLVAHEHCNQFYICSARVPVARPCPKGLMYNAKKERCDWADSVNCGDRIIPNDNIENCTQDNDNNTDDSNDDDNDDHQGNDDPSKAPEICAEEDSAGVLISHEYCNQFYICENSRPLTMKCPKNLLFNPKKNQCDWAQNVNCRGRIHVKDNVQARNLFRRETAGYDYPSNARNVCANEESEDVLLAHKYCNKFYQCANHEPVQRICPRGLYFSSEAQFCDWPEKVDCGDRIIPKENEDDADKDDSEKEKEPVGSNYDDPSKAPEICAQKDSDNVQVAHEYCNKFYKCVNNQPFPMKCPENLYYNPKIGRCDWQNNVQCNGRIKE
ncbi:hypothetical protein O3G_MSEX001893 [Manduca sexta]|uniref:Chitin-binding type-2 domain-containing protein n=1 Tax=Manduca sexta TaxID=7130 RepID=A0A921YLJ9_MANSE|nr:hypothetical protein O3G_MSEX001893 [Manduca sexta]KAG6441556.1 hypothetical protein O3G_MSEX001893 [Manduca sexta]